MGRIPENKTNMEKSENENSLTVQEVIDPVPAAECSEQAGYPSSSSSVCNVTPVNSLAGITDNVTSNNENENMENGDPQENSVDQAQTESRNYSEQKPNYFSELGDLILDLLDFFKDKNNIHLAIKWKVRKMRSVYNKARDEIYCNTAKPCSLFANKVTQTSPLVWPKKREEKRKKDKSETSAKMPTPKRARRNPKSQSGKPPDDMNTEKPLKNIPVNGDQPTTSEKWTKVKKRKTNRFRKPKPDKLIISSKDETSYADILRHIRTDPELKDLGEEVSKIRRTQKGDLLLELKSTGKDTTERFNEKIITSLNGKVEIKTHKEETVIFCKDMDDITTKSEISQAIARELQMPELDETIVKSMWKTYGGTQSAKITLPTVAARRVLALRKIKIGWSVCRLREMVTVTKCFRCLEFGHIAKFCKADTDRSHHCLKCGLEGHIAKQCERDLNCMLCKANGEKDLNHVAGSYRCPVFQKALSNRTK